MTDKVHPLYAARVWQMGASVVFPLAKAVMAQIGARAGDLMLVRVHPPYITFRIARPGAVVPVENFEPDILPPAWPNAPANIRKEGK